ncbi:hypothetical protein M758_5G108100, partial [Ceratodon purpureus]
VSLLLHSSKNARFRFHSNSSSLSALPPCPKMQLLSPPLHKTDSFRVSLHHSLHALLRPLSPSPPKTRPTCTIQCTPPPPPPLSPQLLVVSTPCVLLTWSHSPMQWSMDSVQQGRLWISLQMRRIRK